MSKKLTVGLAIVCLLSLGGSAFAELDTIDVVPAATLLLPYFEVDLAGGGITTLFSINNASAAATIAHVTLWTNESVPTLDFDVYLTGFDVQTISLSEIFLSGNLPITADFARDPGDSADPNDGISNFGALSPPAPGIGDVTFPACATNLPLPPGFLNDGFLLPYIQAAHTGNSVNGQGLIPSGCYGYNLGDQIARGYITVDDTSACSLLFPNAPFYFAEGGTGIATNENQLWGDYFIVDTAENFAFGDTLVHIEAEGLPFDAYVAGDYTFYGRYLGWAATDGREPLGSVWAVRYLEGGGFTGGTDLIVWRDSKALSAVQGNCANNQVWYPLGQNQAVAFDERENPVELCRIGGSRVSPPTNQQQTCFPLETQRVPVRGPSLVGAALNVPFNFGWLYLNLNTSVVPGVAPLAQLPPTQSHVTTNMSALGAFSVGFSGTVLVHTSDGLDPILSPVPIQAPCPGPSCP